MVLVGERESFTRQDVFLSVMIRLLVPSFQKSIVQVQFISRKRDASMCPALAFDE